MDKGSMAKRAYVDPTQPEPYHLLPFGAYCAGYELITTPPWLLVWNEVPMENDSDYFEDFDWLTNDICCSVIWRDGRVKQGTEARLLSPHLSR